MSILVETRITGTRRIRYLQELFGNSANFPIAIILLEMLLEGPSEYIRHPDLYVIIFATLSQAYILTKWRETPKPQLFWGNLIGPILYTVVEASIEGIGFFAGPHHIAYWGYAIITGSLQNIRPRLSKVPRVILSILEGVVRSTILLVMYFIFEMETANQQPYTITIFLGDNSHIFVTIAIVLLGASSGLAGATTEHYLGLLRRTSAQLKEYSEWLLGRDLLEQIITDPTALTMEQKERTVLFMDIRGFTSWSETQPPNEVADMLNQYYQAAEAVLQPHAIKMKFSADEVMAVFSTSIEDNVSVSLELQDRISKILGEHKLGAGIGMHTGLVVEGLLGSKGVRFYDAIGDTVNTAKRIEGNAGHSEILVSEAIRSQLGNKFSFGSVRRITVKGKEHPLEVYPLQKSANPNTF